MGINLLLRLMRQTKTGGKRLAVTIEKGVIAFRNGQWIDTYNMASSDIAGTILTGVDFRNMYYVTQVIEND